MYIFQKIASQKSANFASEFPSRKDSKTKKKYISRLRGGLETLLASIKCIAFGTINHYRLIRERLETYPPSNYRQGLGTQSCSNQWHGLGVQPAATAFSYFTNASDISEVTSSPTKAPGTSYSLKYWRRHCMGIKNSTPTTDSLCKYT